AVPRPGADAPSAALDIAVIGLSGRYPQSPDLRAYWHNLRDGRDCVVEIPEDRWDWRAHYSPDRDAPGRHYSRWGGFIDDVDRFDPLFFNISPREAAHLDPQERLFLEHAWTAMEDAGYTRERLRRTDGEAGPGAVGVYAGVMWGQYQLLFPGGDPHTVPGNPHALGSSYSSIANRVSFVLNLNGPSMAVDTMCSSSLTAVELACRDLSRGRIGLAFAGGVNVTVHPNKYLALSAGQFISGKGHCESFGIGGDGYIPGEGVGVALLKPLRDAERDGDHIYGVIKGSALSHGGRTNGYTVPSPRAQQAAIVSALRESGADPRTISYVEAHGTGTRLGDPIEITGLSEAFRAATPDGGADGGDRPYCLLGSVKSNIGHCESAAGIAGLTKVLLQMKHGRIAPSLHSATLNPNIDFAATPFVVNQELRDWERPVVDGRAHPRIAGVSSFGAGGSNAHLVVAEHVDRRPVPADDAPGPLVFPLSAKTADRLQAYAGELLRFAREQEHEEVTGGGRATAADLAYTLQTGREAMEERLAVVADSFAALAGTLERYLDGREPVDGLYRGTARRGRGTVTAPPRTRETGAGAGEDHGPAALAARWAGGEPVDWETLYVPGAPAPRRISAPTYPFARERHWAPATAAPAPGARAATTPVTETPVTDAPLTVTPVTHTPAGVPQLTGPGAHGAPGRSRTALFLTKRWREEPQAAGRTPHTSVLVLHDRTTAGLAAALAGRLDDAVPLDVAADDAEAVVARRIGACTAWIDLTGIAGDTPDGPAREHGGACGRAVTLLQSALEAKAARGIRLLYVTRGLESPGAPWEAAGRGGSLAGAARAALHRLLGHEYRGLTSCHLDLDPGVRGDAEQASVILGELTDGARDPEVCHRGGVRLVPVLAEAAPPAARAPRPAFGPGEVLLVTGGTRGLGLLCARHLVEHYGVRHLVLTGREPLPPRGRWADPDLPPAVREKIGAVLELEARGVEVRVLALPLDRAGEVAAALARTESTLGPITGVIHAAGLVDTRNPAFVRKPAADIARVVSPKTDGTAHLLAALDGRSPRFVLLFSSVSAVIPALGAGQSDYAMGNAFLDYAAQAHAADLPVTSIQWPSWRETGFGEVTARAYTDTGLLSITDAEGLAFLDDILTAPRGPVVMPVRVDAGRFDPGALLGSPRPAPAARPASGQPPAASAVAAPAPVASAPAAGLAAVRERLVGFLRRTFEDQLGLERGRLDEDVSYADYGADSILLAQVFQRIRQRLDLELDPSALLDHPTLGELAAWLLSAHPAEVAARFGPGPQPAGEPAGASASPAAPERTARPGEPDGPDGPGEPGELDGPDGPGEPEGPEELDGPDAPDEPGGPEGAYGRAARTPADGPRHRDTAVAVIGMAARLPGAPDIDAYWELLSHGRSAIRAVPADRWGGETDARAGIVDDVYGFDTGYFMLHAEDARAMDPQALVLLEECLKAVHHAGYRPAELDGTRTGVFVGARSRGRTDDTAVDEARNPVMAVGQNYLAANVSQFFDWHGPALVVDTACSSSLVAMRAAADALVAGSADLALVAGVSLLTDDSAHVLFRRRGLLREDGTFHLFDRRAGGVVLGEGAGVVVLKPLDRAERDGDTVYAVIEGIALNNDGRTAGPATPLSLIHL
ncbi:KR domain-containing protein, partial [Streptomyces sp. PRKS01-65]